MRFRVPTLPALLRIAAAAAALVAAWGPHVGSEPRSRLRIVGIDVSASAGESAVPRADLPALLRDIGARDRAAVLVFGADARVAARPGPADRVAVSMEPVASGADASSLAALLRTAAALRSASGGEDACELVVVSDGRATDAPGDLLLAARALGDAGGADVRFVLRDSAVLPPVVRELRGPGRVALGEPFALEARGVAPAAGGTLVLSRAGTVVERRAVRGAFRAAFARIEETAGSARYSAAVEGGAPAAESVVLVAAPGSVLVISDRPASAFRAAFAGTGRRLERASPRESARAVFSSHDLVLVDGLTADVLDPIVPALERHVRTGGAALLLGGPAAFAAGGWEGRAIEGVSPLVTRPPGDGGVFVVLAIDASGSMGRTWPGAGVRRDAAVGAAATAFVARSGADVRVAVRRFNDRVLGAVAAVVHDGSPAGRAAASAELLAAPEPGGSTAFAPILSDALAQVAARGEARRHLVIFSDGETAEDAPALSAGLARLRGAGVTVAIVVPGTASGDAPLLVAARAAGVPVFPADAPSALDAALRRVAETIAGPDRFAGPAEFAPAAGAETSFPRGGGRVAERNIAFAAEGASPLLIAADGRVFAAQRALGAGRVVAVAADAVTAVGGEAAGGEGRILRDLIAVAARPASASLRAERTEGGRGAVLRIRADTDRPIVMCVFETESGEIARVAVSDEGRGILRAEIPRGARPLLARFLDASGAEVSACGVDRPAPAEHLGPQVADLDGIAAAARGTAVARGTPLRPWFALLAALLLVAAAALPALLVRQRPAKGHVKSPSSATR